MVDIKNLSKICKPWCVFLNQRRRQERGQLPEGLIFFLGENWYSWKIKTYSGGEGEIHPRLTSVCALSCSGECELWQEARATRKTSLSPPRAKLIAITRCEASRISPGAATWKLPPAANAENVSWWVYCCVSLSLKKVLNGHRVRASEMPQPSALALGERVKFTLCFFYVPAPSFLGTYCTIIEPEELELSGTLTFWSALVLFFISPLARRQKRILQNFSLSSARRTFFAIRIKLSKQLPTIFNKEIAAEFEIIPL